MIRLLSKFGFLTTVLFILPSCALLNSQKNMKEDIFKIQTRLLELEKGVEKDNAGISKRADSATKGVASVSTTVAGLEREVQQLGGQVDMFKYALQNGEMPGAMKSEDSLFSRLSNVEERVAQLEETQKDVLAMLEAIESGKKSKKSNLKDDKKISSLASAREAFKKRRYSYLKRDIPNLKKKMKKTSSKKELSYLYAESLYKLGNLKEAAIAFHDFLGEKPPKKYVPHAKMRMGDCYRHLGDRDTASIYYEELISEYPKTTEADWAKERLAKITKR